MKIEELHPARSLPRVHLSTALMLMLAASVLLWLNVRPQRRNETLDENGRLIQYECARGWPIPCYEDCNVYLWWSIDPPSPEPKQQQTLAVGKFQWSRVTIDLVVNASSLLALAVACEWIIRVRTRGGTHLGRGAALPLL